MKKLLEEGDPNFQFVKDIDENTPAGMCYTSATTGIRKGVVYTHRSTRTALHGTRFSGYSCFIGK